MPLFVWYAIISVVLYAIVSDVGLLYDIALDGLHGVVLYVLNGIIYSSLMMTYCRNSENRYRTALLLGQLT